MTPVDMALWGDARASLGIEAAEAARSIMMRFPVRRARRHVLSAACLQMMKRLDL